MVRAIALFSLVTTNLMLAACSSNGSGNSNKTPVNQQYRGGVNPALVGGGSSDAMLANGNANQVAMQNSGGGTVRAQRVEDPQDVQPPVLGGGATAANSTAPVPGSSFNDYSYDDASGTATSKYTPYNIDPLIIADAQREQQKQMAAAQAAQVAQQAAAAPAPVTQPSTAPAAPAAAAETSVTQSGDTTTYQSTDQSGNSVTVTQNTDAPAPNININGQQTSAPTAPAATTETATAAPTSAPGQFDIINSAKITLVKADDAQWSPGLPHEPATQPILTQLSRADKAAYTDGKFDSIMATIWNAYNSNADLIKGNEEFAKQVRDVHIVGYEKNHVTSYTVAVNIEEDGNWAQLVFNGHRDLGKVLHEIETANAPKAAKAATTKKSTKKNAKVKETEVKDVAHLAAESRTFDLVFDKNSKSAAPLKYHYFAVAHCSDKLFKTCENVIIEIKRLDLNAQNLSAADLKKAKPVAMARIVNRLGAAVITTDAKDQAKSAAHQAFNQLLADSKDKAIMHVWAVAGGPSQAEVIFPKDTPKDDLYFKKALVLRGELVTVPDQSQIMFSVVEGSPEKARDAWFKDKQVQLISNDGGGDLNFKISFGDADESERISVTSNFALTRAPKSEKKQ